MSAKFDDAPAPMTLAAFLEWEHRQPERWEFIAGEPRMMVGGSLRHNRIVGNCYVALRAVATSSPCQAFVEAVKVIAAEQCHYPDVILARAEQDEASDIVQAPTVIIEVLSPSTQRDDRIRKWENYKTLPSLQAYLLVAQDHVSVHAFLRDGEGWEYRHLTSTDDVLDVPGIGPRLAVADLYLDALG